MDNHQFSIPTKEFEKKSLKRQVMLDIESMGTGSNSAIVSIAAVIFDINSGEVGDIFYTNVSLQSSLDAGLKVTGDTIMWWLQQSEEARLGLIKGGAVDLKTALTSFNAFLYTNLIWNPTGVDKPKDFGIWGNGPVFDLGIMYDAYRAVGIEPLWNRKNERCVRTLTALAPLIRLAVEEEAKVEDLVKHNALQDCLTQIKWVSRIVEELGLRNKYR